MSSKLTLAQWRAAVAGAATEIATYALQLPAAVVQDPVGAEGASAMIGAHIPMMGGGQAFDLAVVAVAEDCKALARAILCMAPGAAIRDAEVADAVGEIVNMLAGSVKRRMSSDRDLELGLPIFLHGYIQPSEKLTVIALPTRFGTIETMVLIAGQRGQIAS
jgi:hypothetical protein